MVTILMSHAAQILPSQPLILVFIFRKKCDDGFSQKTPLDTKELLPKSCEQKSLSGQSG